MKNKQKIIFSNSYSPRTGHNFVSEVIKIFSGHEVLVHNKSETKLSNLLDKYFEISSSIYYKSDREFFDRIILKRIREAILSESENEFVMIKNTSFEGVNALPKVFPEDIHILLLRNPIDVFNSVFKAMDLNKKGFKYKLKKVGKLCGLYPYYFCRKISSKTIKHIPSFDNFYIIKYEDLVNRNEEVLKSLKQKFNTPKSLEQIKNEVDSIK
ncbi:MAG: sulfotransferase, partial [Bacteroidia bacterium]|nr:sulfotransferase [Bacteroidia bacterium]